MKVGPLTLFSRCSDNSLSIASWHSPHSLTWRWSIHLSHHKVLAWKPYAFMYKNHHHRGFGGGFGRLLWIGINRDNNGWQGSAAALWWELSFYQQAPMWYRDIYRSMRDEELERDFSSQAHVPLPTITEHRTIQ